MWTSQERHCFLFSCPGPSKLLGFIPGPERGLVLHRASGTSGPVCLASHRAMADTGAVCWAIFGTLGAHRPRPHEALGVFLSLMGTGSCSGPQYIAESLLRS